MVQKSGVHQLRLVVYPIYPTIYTGFYMPGGTGFPASTVVSIGLFFTGGDFHFHAPFSLIQLKIIICYGRIGILILKSHKIHVRYISIG